MKYNEQSAQQVAAYLLQIKAVKLNVTDPFTWTSGMRSPIYCDNRVTLSFPEIRDFIRDEFAKIIREKMGNPDVIAGVATGGIAQGALVAQELNLPFVYIRSSQKGHGLENKIEGVIEKGQKVVIVEDLVSTGKSSLNAVDALVNAGCEVLGMVAIFSYNLDVAIQKFENKSVQLYTLSDYDTLINKALEINYVNQSDLGSLVEWKKSPQKWAEKF
jgi:orotate phosphoribosyltransferase